MPSRCARYERPLDHATERRNELTPPHVFPSGRRLNLPHRQSGCASQQIQVANVRFGSKADIAAPLSNVRFTPNSGHAGLLRFQVDLLLDDDRECERKCGALAGL